MLVYIQTESDHILQILTTPTEQYLQIMLMDIVSMMMGVMVRKNIEFMLFDP